MCRVRGGVTWPSISPPQFFGRGWSGEGTDAVWSLFHIKPTFFIFRLKTFGCWHFYFWSSWSHLTIVCITWMSGRVCRQRSHCCSLANEQSQFRGQMHQEKPTGCVTMAHHCRHCESLATHDCNIWYEILKLHSLPCDSFWDLHACLTGAV